MFLATSMLAGCASIARQDSAAAEPVAPASTAESEVTVLYVSLQGVAYDPVTGDPVPALCAGPTCLNLTPKVLQVPRQPAAQAQRHLAAPQANKPQTAPSRSPTSERPQTLQLRLPFAYNSSALSSQAEAELLRALAPVSGHVQTVQIIGVADSLQRDQYNLGLAQRRADAVAMFLRPHLGTATFSTSARVFKVPAEGYPPDEPHNARRADLSVLLITDTSR